MVYSPVNIPLIYIIVILALLSIKSIRERREREGYDQEKNSKDGLNSHADQKKTLTMQRVEKEA